jgi:hypothetical protein
VDDDSQPVSPSIAQALLDALKGREPRWPQPPYDHEELRARLATGDDDARELALGLAHEASLESRVEQALALERTPVVLADGSRLSLDDAERLLADKEARRVFAPLRGSLDEAMAPLAEQLRASSQRFEDEAEQLLGPAVVPPALAALTDELDDTLQDPAREALRLLEEIGGAPARDAAGLARAVDLPDPEGFSDRASRELVRRARQAAERVLARDVVALRAPRAMLGLVVSAAEGGVRAAVVPSRTAGRFLANTRAGLGAAAAALAPAGALAVSRERELRVLGEALTLGALPPPARRRVFGESAADADRRARVAAAAHLVGARALVRAARVSREEGCITEAVAEGLADALDTDPPFAWARALLSAPWPGRLQLARTAEGLAQAAWALSEAGRRAMELRDRFDESFGEREELWASERESLFEEDRADGSDAASAGDEAGDGAGDGARGGEAAGIPLVGWLGELL